MSEESPTKEPKESDASLDPPETQPEIESETLPQSTEGPSIGGWFNSFVQSAKVTVSKSAGTLESIKRDLSEFKDAMQNDATSMVYSTASIVKNKLNEIGNTVNEIGSLGTDEIEEDIPPLEDDVKKEEIEATQSKETTTPSDDLPFNLETLNSWANLITDRAKSTINTVKETLAESIFINRDFLIDELEEEPYVLKEGEVVPIKNWKELLHQLQTNSDTYCREPNGPPEEFDLWLTKFNLMNYQKQMEYLLENVPEIRKLHEDLVPKEMSDSDFWHRYYYKVHQLKEEQKRNILNSGDSAHNTEAATANEMSQSNVNIKYLNEKSTTNNNSDSRADSESKVSRSSTEDWEKMTDPEHPEKSSSDEDRDWVKCD